MKAGFQSVKRGNDLKNISASLRHNLEILTGVTGNGLKRAVLVEDLLKNPSLGLSFNDRTKEFYLTPVINPETIPIPTNVTAQGAFTNIIVEWDAPNFSSFAYAELWRSAVDDFGTAIRVATTRAPIIADDVGYAQTYYYWVRFVNTDNIDGPIHSTSGVSATTAPNISFIIEQLSDELNETHLAIALRSRIDLIDTPITGLVDQMTSANADIDLLEAAVAALEGDGGGYAAAISALDARVTVNEGDIDSNALAIIALQSDVIDAEGNISANATAISTLNTSVTSLSGTVSAQAIDITTLQTTVSGHTATISTHTSSINGLEAQWLVQTDVNNLVGGVGFYNNGVTTQFMVNAETFAVLAPDDSYVNPFFITGGVTYIDTALIANGAIQVAQIETLTTDDITGFTSSFVLSTIGIGNITNAYIGDFIQSDNYVAGVSGWRIDKDGTAEFVDIFADFIEVDEANVISTIMLQGNAVTIPVGSYNASAVAISTTSPVVIQTLSFTSAGQPALITFAGLLSSSSGELIQYTLERSVNSAAYQEVQSEGVYGVFVDNGTDECMGATHMDYDLDNGDSVVYRIRAWLFSGTAAACYMLNRSLNVIECKR